MLSPQQRHRRRQAVLQSSLVAAWLSGALLVGRLTQKFVPLGDRTNLSSGQRSGTIVKGASPSQTFPSVKPSNELDATSAILGGLAAACVALAVAVRMPLPGPVVDTSATQVSQLTFATQQSADIAVPQGVIIAGAGLSTGLASVAATTVILQGNQVMRPGPLQGEQVENLRMAPTAEKPTRAAEIPVTAEDIRDEKSASILPAPGSCAPTPAIKVIAEVGVHDRNESLGISGAHKVNQYTQKPDAHKNDETTKLRQFLLSTPPPPKMGFRLA